ncbi:MAG: hypothetical protein AOA65_1902 [Candidatus Bathyarchaeota archaeon BA1]|nr:MAG: hypothetical protein AOA65_1902 [Candidatus Bathyarchaeota archaeon BA1]
MLIFGKVSFDGPIDFKPVRNLNGHFYAFNVRVLHLILNEKWLHSFMFSFIPSG